VDTVRVRYVGNRQFVGWDAAGHGLVMDARTDFKGEGTGPRPVELVLYGLAGCTAMDVVSVLEKKRMPADHLEIVVEGVQREDEYPHFYERISVHYTVIGKDVTREAVARAIELSEQKYCSVKGMFGPQVSVTSSFDVLAEMPPAAGKAAE
jgi:putative redox protein